MKLLISCILARTQRDFKVDICYHLWQGNHPHIVAILKDADQARCFYMELQKKLTDAIKRRGGGGGALFSQTARDNSLKCFVKLRASP